MIRRVEDGDYEMIAQWWDKRGFPRAPKEILPPDGWVVYAEAGDGTIPVMAGWLYVARGEPTPKMGMFMWGVSDPDVPGEFRHKAWDELMMAVDEAGKSYGLWLLYHITSPEPVIKRMESHGYVVHETGGASMLKQLVKMEGA